MQLSTRGRYAVMAMLDLAEMSLKNGKTYPVALAEIATRQDISLSYLEQLFASLRRAGLVKSMRGPGGGYMPQRDLNHIAISDIIHAVNEPTEMTRCGHHKTTKAEGQGCVGGKRCNAHGLWASLGEHIEQFLRHVSLAQVLDNKLPLPQLLEAAATPAKPGRVQVQIA